MKKPKQDPLMPKSSDPELTEILEQKKLATRALKKVLKSLEPEKNGTNTGKAINQ
jgi:hypothetical protein